MSIHGQIRLGEGTVWHGGNYTDITDMRKTFAELKASGVTVIWNLLEDDLTVKLERKAFHVIHTPTEDFGLPLDSDRFLRDTKRIMHLLRSGQNVFIHCEGGHGRTGMGVLALYRLFKKENVVSEVKRIVGGPETAEQVKFVMGLPVGEG